MLSLQVNSIMNLRRLLHILQFSLSLLHLTTNTILCSRILESVRYIMMYYACSTENKWSKFSWNSESSASESHKQMDHKQMTVLTCHNNLQSFRLASQFSLSRHVSMCYHFYLCIRVIVTTKSIYVSNIVNKF